MKANKTDSDISVDDLEPISKTKLKAEADALQDIGVKLLALPKDKINKLKAPEALLDAIWESKRLTSNGAIKRHKQYVGSLMRNIDPAPIVEQLEKWEGKNNAENAHFHQIERLRDQLISEESALAGFIEKNPNVDIQRIRTLIRNARKEQEKNKPPKSSRELFKLLREILDTIASSTNDTEETIVEDTNNDN